VLSALQTARTALKCRVQQSIVCGPGLDPTASLVARSILVFDESLSTVFDESLALELDESFLLVFESRAFIQFLSEICLFHFHLIAQDHLSLS